MIKIVSGFPKTSHVFLVSRILYDVNGSLRIFQGRAEGESARNSRETLARAFFHARSRGILRETTIYHEAE